MITVAPTAPMAVSRVRTFIPSILSVRPSILSEGGGSRTIGPDPTSRVQQAVLVLRVQQALLVLAPVLLLLALQVVLLVVLLVLA